MTKALFICLIGIKIASILTFSGILDNTTFSPNPDEVLIAEVAYNVNQGRGFVTSIEIKSKVLNETFVPTAIRPSYPVFLHIVFQKLYFNKLPTSFDSFRHTYYYFFYSVIISVLNVILFTLSVFSFYSISKSVMSSTFWARASCLALCLYPSVLIYIGATPLYESLSLYLLIILVNLFQRSFIHDFPKVGFVEILLLIVACLGPLIRPQLFILYGLLAVFALIVSFLKGNNNQRLYLRQVGLGSLVLLVLFNIPVLVKNNRTIGRLTLSTASSFELLEGHNPFARGSWCGECGKENHPFHPWVREKIPNYDQLDEWSRSTYRANLAKDWILSNPGKELVLIARKMAIFFLPYNYEHLTFNPFNALAHLGFFGFIFSMIAKFKSIKTEFFWSIIVILGTIMLSQIWFVGYRWRYYAEPFIIILALRFWIDTIKYSIPTLFLQFKKP
ncbi:MAG: hypothetical protein ACJASM_001674 [Salibacteraceae bacterium]|jgi:hypothetical protein